MVIVGQALPEEVPGIVASSPRPFTFHPRLPHRGAVRAVFLSLLLLPSFVMADEAELARTAIVGSHTLARDERVRAAACDHAGQVLRDQGGAVAARAALWGRGVRDYGFRPFTMRGPELPDPDRLPLLLGPGFMETRHPAALELCTASAQGSQALVVLLVERALHWLTPSSPGEEPVMVPQGYGAPRVYATAPSGRVEERFAQSLGPRGWNLPIRPGAEPGRWLLEVISDGPTGPEVMALWPTELHGTPQGAVPSPRSSTPADPGPQDALAAERRLWALLSGFRTTWHLPPLRFEPALARAARTHGRDLARGEAFGHVTSSGDALTRIGREGLSAVRAVENAALASSVEEAHAALLSSPAHRMNLLDPGVEVGGVGVVFRKDGVGQVSVAVSEVFARLSPEEGPALEAGLDAGIQATRQGLGLWRLKRREQIDETARGALAIVVDQASLSLSAEQRRGLIDQVGFHFRNAHDVSVHVLATADPMAVAQTGQLRDPDWTEYGLALTRTTVAIGAQPAGTYVVTLILVSR